MSFGNFWEGLVNFAGGDNGFDLDDVLRLTTGAANAYQAYQGTDDQVERPYMMPGQEAGYGQAIADSLAKYQLGPNQYYPGQTVADLDPNVIAGQNNQLSSVDRLQGMADTAGQGALTLAQGGTGYVDGFNLPDQVGFGIPQQYQDAIMNPIMNRLNNQIIPNIHTAATSQGAFGGSRMQQQKADAATQATEAATNAMIQGNLQARQQSIGQRAGDISAQLQGRGQDITQNRMINDTMRAGVDSLGRAMGYQLMPGDVQQDVGQARTAYDQQLINADMNRFDWNRNEGEEYLDRLIARLGLDGAGRTGSVTPGQDGTWIDALGGFISGSNAYSDLFGTGTAPLSGTEPQNR